MNPEFDTDHGMLDAIGRGLEAVEPLPEYLRTQAYGAFSLAALREALAELTFDSRYGTVPLLRGDESEARLLSFANDFLTLDVSLLADSTTLIGEMQPPIAHELMVETRTGEAVAVDVDKFGRFRATCPEESFRLRVTDHMVTPWVTRH